MEDKELIRAAKQGDHEALITLLRHIESHVFKTAYYLLNKHEHDALDITQEALIKIYKKISTYEEKAQFRTWVQRIVTNLCIDKFRGQKPEVPMEDYEMVMIDQQNVEKVVFDAYIIQEVYEAVEQLPERFRNVIILRYMKDFSYNEIAETLNLPLNTVKSYLFRARRLLQTIIEEQEKGEVHGQ